MCVCVCVFFSFLPVLSGLRVGLGLRVYRILGSEHFPTSAGDVVVIVGEELFLLAAVVAASSAAAAAAVRCTTASHCPYFHQVMSP